MKTIRFILSASLLTLLLGSVASPSLTAAPAKEVVLIDFTDVRTDPGSNQVMKNYEYAFGDWDKHLKDTARQGCLVQAPGGEGGLGENKTMVRFGKHKFIDVILVVGNANQAQTVRFSLEDKDGTNQNWNIPIGTLRKGVEQRVRLDLEKSSEEEKPGTVPGLNLAKINVWQFKGDWQKTRVEVLFVKVVAPKE